MSENQNTLKTNWNPFIPFEICLEEETEYLVKLCIFLKLSCIVNDDLRINLNFVGIVDEALPSFGCTNTEYGGRI